MGGVAAAASLFVSSSNSIQIVRRHCCLCLLYSFEIALLSVQCFGTPCSDNYDRGDNICFLGKPLLLLLGDRRTLQSTLPPSLVWTNS